MERDDAARDPGPAGVPDLPSWPPDLFAKRFDYSRLGAPAEAPLPGAGSADGIPEAPALPAGGAHPDLAVFLDLGGSPAWAAAPHDDAAARGGGADGLSFALRLDPEAG